MLAGKKKGKGEGEVPVQGAKPAHGRSEDGEEGEAEECHGVENGAEEDGEVGERKKSNKRPRKRKPKTDKPGGEWRG